MITKLGKELLKSEDNATSELALHPALGTATGLTGARLMDNALSSGDLTGRATLYHGTDKPTAAKIRENGLLPTTDATAVNTKTLKASDPERYAKSLGKSYMTRSGLEAVTYGMGKAIRSGQVKPDDLRGAFKESKTVKINAPLWKMKTTLNPEADMPYAVWKKKLGIMAAFEPESRLRNMYKRLRDSVVVEGAVGPEYVKGAKAYKRLTPQELLEYIRARPKTFAKGLGKASLGVAGVAHGGMALYNALAKQRDVAS